MHCKNVTMHHVDFNLTDLNIRKSMVGHKQYKGTEYLVLENEGDYAVVRIKKMKGSDLFREVTDYSILSLPKNTVFYEDEGLDVLNVPSLALIQEKYPEKTIVVKGMFSHISVVYDLDPIRLRVIDTVPSSPSKLSVLVDEALRSGFIEYPIIVEAVDIDLNEKASNILTDAIMFPCKASGLKCDVPTYYLDELPETNNDTVTLVGCHLSKRIYTEHYGKDVPFVNICPADHLGVDGMKTIIKCCKVKSEHELKRNYVTVPWGATVPEVVRALNHLFRV